MTPIMASILINDMNILKFLIRNQANINLIVNEYTPLIFAIK